MKILQINSSARSAGANSTRLADAITVRLKAANPAAVVELRDLAATGSRADGAASPRASSGGCALPTRSCGRSMAPGVSAR